MNWPAFALTLLIAAMAASVWLGLFNIYSAYTEEREIKAQYWAGIAFGVVLLAVIVGLI